MRTPFSRTAAAFGAATLFSAAVGVVTWHAAARADGPIHELAAKLPPMVERALAVPGSRWVRSESAAVNVYALEGTRAAAEAARVRAEAEAARAANLELLGDAEFVPRLHLVYVPTRAQMWPIVGAGPGGSAEPQQYAAALVTGDEVRAPVKHETMHILSWAKWGDAKAPWLAEGMATYAVGGCGGRDLHAIAAALDAEHRLVPLGDLPRAFDVKGERGAAMYIQAGSVVKYVAESYGTPRLREFYRTGLAGARASLGVEVPALERGWRARIARAATGERWSAIYDDIRTHGCE